MLRSENAAAARRLIDSLRTTITTSAEAVEQLKRSYDHRPAGNLEEVKRVSHTIRTDVEKLQGEVESAHHLMKAPPASDLLDAGFQQVGTVDRILEMFEVRLREAYGIEIKVDEEKPESEDDAPAEVVSDVEEMTNISTITEAKTPRKVSPKFDDVMPVTPKLEDFGISSDDLKALQIGPAEVPDDSCFDEVRKVSIGSGDYGEAVKKSMTALGIETPVEVADKFSARRHIALRGVMPGTTPRMMAGDRVDYTSLAGGYYEGRQLDFGE